MDDELLEECTFVDVAQFKALNDVLKIDSRRDVVKDIDVFGKRKIVKHDDFTLKAEMPKDSIYKFRFVPSTHRLLVAIQEELGKHGRQEIRLTVDSYMQRCGLANRGETRKQLKVDLQCLAAIRFDLTTRKGAVIKDCRLCEIAELRTNGIIYVKLSDAVIAHWKDNLGLMQMPRLYFTLDRKRYQAAPMLLYYISLMRHISNKTGLHKDVLRIESLLAVTILPTVEQVRETRNGSIKERIVERFFRELHALDSEMKFQYTRNAKPISETAVKRLRYEDFTDVCVHVTWLHEDQFRDNGKTVAADGRNREK